jgi:hypothetical protein
MRCADLTGTWSKLCEWLDARNVLVLPRLTGDGLTVRLDGDLDADRAATPAEVDRIIERLRQVIDRFAVPAVYVGQVCGEPDGDLSGVTVRVMAAGILHELTLDATWHAEDLFDLEQSLVPSVG